MLLLNGLSCRDLVYTAFCSELHAVDVVWSFQNGTLHGRPLDVWMLSVHMINGQASTFEDLSLLPPFPFCPLLSSSSRSEILDIVFKYI